MLSACSRGRSYQGEDASENTHIGISERRQREAAKSCPLTRTVSSPVALFTSQTDTATPRSASASAMARPMPAEAPVISALLPWKKLIAAAGLTASAYEQPAQANSSRREAGRASFVLTFPVTSADDSDKSFCVTMDASVEVRTPQRPLSHAGHAPHALVAPRRPRKSARAMPLLTPEQQARLDAEVAASGDNKCAEGGLPQRPNSGAAKNKKKKGLCTHAAQLPCPHHWLV